jgi:hypothetical protein
VIVVKIYHRLSIIVHIVIRNFAAGDGGCVSNEDKCMKGATFYIVFGKRGSYGFFKDGPSIRFSLGWVAICFSWIDLEIAMQNSTKYMRLLERKIANQPLDSDREESGSVLE